MCGDVGVGYQDEGLCVKMVVGWQWGVKQFGRGQDGREEEDDLKEIFVSLFYAQLIEDVLGVSS